MAKKKRRPLDTAKKYSDLLLYEVTGGNMGTKPAIEIKESVATFGEKRALLDTLIKIATLEEKNSEDEEDSGFEAIMKKAKKDGSSKSGNRGNPWGTKDPEPSGDSDTDQSDENEEP